MSYFAAPVMSRKQRVLIPTTLDDAISGNHEVRVLDEILRSLDWSEWEAKYCGVRGQPPIHPRVVASIILYGLLRRIRSSRMLEYMTGHNIDFMWLSEGRTLDHSTIAGFRTEFKKELRSTFRQLGRIAMKIGMVRLGEVTFDGTRTKSNNGRFETLTAADLEKELTELVEKFGQLLDESEQTDTAENVQFGLSEKTLPPDLADAKARSKKLREAIDELQAAEATRRRKAKIDPNENPAQLPGTDQDSKVLPNKEGGFAPNYTPVTGVDVELDYIVYADVIAHANENTQLEPMVEQVKDDFGKCPAAVLTDGLNATGQNIAAMEQRGIEFLTPPPKELSVANPAQRDVPSEPIAESLIPQLPINPQTKTFDRTCFIYDTENDIYYCPQGKTLEFEKSTPEVRQGEKITIRIYRCSSCEGCPFKAMCVADNNKNGRTVRRDVYTKVREQHAAKMKLESAAEKYKHRFHAAETPFGWLKHVLGLRQFLLRGLDKVQTEWLWACTAYNLRKHLSHAARLRALSQPSTIKVES
jgi:transposase